MVVPPYYLWREMSVPNTLPVLAGHSLDSSLITNFRFMVLPRMGTPIACVGLHVRPIGARWRTGRRLMGRWNARGRVPDR